MDSPLARVVLHGRLRGRFGPEFNIAASTAARAVQVLCILVPGFREEVAEGAYRVVRGPLRTGAAIDARGLYLRLPPSGEMHLIPLARGAAKSGVGPVGKIVIGVVLVIAAFVLPELAPEFVVAAGGLTTTVLGATVWTGLALFGGALVLGGIGQMISTQPSTPLGGGAAANTASFLLGGQLNVAQQGGPVPVVYGRVMVGSVVVSLGYEAAAFVQGSGDSAWFNSDAGFSGGVVPATGASGGGKSGGGSGTSGVVEEPNNLRSTATVRIIDLISEGPVAGLVDGPKSIYFDNTPLMASDGSWNFRGVTWEFRHGYPDQDPVNGFPSSEETISVATEVKASAPVIQTVINETANAMRVTIQIPALYDTDVKTGNVHGTNLLFTIEVRPSRAGPGGWAGSYQPMVGEAINGGKCTSPYERSYRFDLPMVFYGANTFDVRVTRLTPDSDRTTLANGLVFELITMITDHQLMYPDSAYIALTVDAQAFGSSIPSRTYLIDGRQVAVPQNYDPVTRTYSSGGPGTTGGTWDSISFKNVSTSNPAWIFYDMLTHERYGCHIPGSPLETTRASLYVISQYCDELVPDGFGSYEPRYGVNVGITAQVEAYVLLQTMVSAFRGMTYWGAGQVMVTADMPKRPVKLVNQTNVADGAFNYQGSSLKTRHNIARVTWRDPAHQYLPAPESVELTADIARRGVIAADIVAWGCTSRGLAHRLGKWLLYTENNQVETLEYEAGLYHLDLRPGEVFQQHDPSYFGLRWGGRLRAGSTVNVLRFDTLFDPGAGSSFLVTVVMPDNTVADRAFGRAQLVDYPSWTEVYLTVPLPEPPSANAEWIVIDNEVSPRLFQAVSIGTTEPGRYAVSAVSHDPQKYDYVDRDIALKVNVYSLLPGFLIAALAPPSNVSAIDYMTGAGSTTILRVTVSWTPAQDVRISGYQVRVTGATVSQIYAADGASKDIDGLQPAAYVFSVRSISKAGAASVWVSAPSVAVDGSVDPPEAPLGLTAVGGTRRVSLVWAPVPRRDLKYYEVQRAPDAGGPTTFSTIAYANSTAFLDAQSDLLIPYSIWWYRVRAVTTTDVNGSWSNQVFARTTLLIVDDLADGIINTAKFANTIKPVLLIDNLGALGLEGDVAFNTATGRLMKFTGGVWIFLIDFAGIMGQANDAQIAGLAAAKITGQLTDLQLADIAAAKITGQITTTQISDNSISTPKLQAGSVSANEIAAYSIVSWNIAANAITAAQIAAGSIQTAHITAGAVTANEIAAYSIIAGKIGAGAVDTNALQADSIVAGKVAAGAIRATEIRAGEIRSDHLASDFQLTQSAQIGTAVIGTAQIGDLTVTHAKIGSLEVNTSNISNNAVSHIAAANGGGGQSIVIYTDGSPVLVWGVAIADPHFPSNNYLHVTRDGNNLIYYWPQMMNAGASTWPIPFSYVDFPGPGFHTYSVSMDHGTGGAATTIIATVLKK